MWNCPLFKHHLLRVAQKIMPRREGRPGQRSHWLKAGLGLGLSVGVKPLNWRKKGEKEALKNLSALACCLHCCELSLSDGWGNRVSWQSQWSAPLNGQ